MSRMEEFENAQSLFKKHKRKMKKAEKALRNSQSDFLSSEHMSLELKFQMHKSAMERAEEFMELANPF